MSNIFPKNIWHFLDCQFFIYVHVMLMFEKYYFDESY